MEQKEESFKLRDEGAKHCYFVITPIDSDGNVVVVNCSSYRGTKQDDTTCILNPGDHPFITHTSYIAYRFAKMMKYSDVQKLNPVRDVSKELYEKIREGAKNSDHTPIKIYQYMLNH